MNPNQVTALYARVLRQLLPEGGYDTAQGTVLSKDIYAHAKAFAQIDLDAHRLLTALTDMPPEMLSEYEQQYGLPLKCQTNVSMSYAERIALLNEMRSKRNTLNYAYVEWILSLFGVELLAIDKYVPMQCTAPCNRPVETERSRFKVKLRLANPVNADMQCIIENYLPSYLRVEWYGVSADFGAWVVNSTVTVNSSGIAHYTGYKTNGYNYYDSYANINLVNAIAASLYNESLRLWQGVIDAIMYFTAGEAYTVHSGYIQFNRYSYTYFYSLSPSNESNDRSTPELACKVKGESWNFIRTAPDIVGQQVGYCRSYYRDGNITYGRRYVSSAIIQVTFNEIGEQVIAHLSSINASIQLHAENYAELIANSIFEAQETDQYVKLTDLISQFEVNKILRTSS